MLMPVVRILVVDDFAEWRLCIRSILQARPDWQVIDEVGDGLEAVHKAAELRPEIVLLDIGMPILNGIEAAKHIQRANPHTKIIFVTQDTDRDIRTAALATGAAGYLLKASVSSTLLLTIDGALRDGHYSPTARE